MLLLCLYAKFDFNMGVLSLEFEHNAIIYVKTTYTVAKSFLFTRFIEFEPVWLDNKGQALIKLSTNTRTLEVEIDSYYFLGLMDLCNQEPFEEQTEDEGVAE